MSETLPTPGQTNWGGPLNTVLGDLDTRLGTVEGSYVTQTNANGTYAPITPAVNTRTGSYTLALSDAGGNVDVNSSSAATVTVPPNSSVAFPVGTIIEITQLGTGKVTIAPGSGVTVKSSGSVYSAGGQYVTVGLRKTATDTWLLTGYLVA